MGLQEREGTLRVRGTHATLVSDRETPAAHLGSIWESSLSAKMSFWRKAALSSKPSLASAASSRPWSSSARGLT